MARIPTIHARAGDTFRVFCRTRSGAGPGDLAGYGIEAALMGSDGLIHAFAIPPVSDEGVIALYADDDVTRGWPSGRVVLTVRLTSPAGDVVSSAPVPVMIEREMI